MQMLYQNTLYPIRAMILDIFNSPKKSGNKIYCEVKISHEIAKKKIKSLNQWSYMLLNNSVFPFNISSISIPTNIPKFY
jgi:hypothetical protein